MARLVVFVIGVQAARRKAEVLKVGRLLRTHLDVGDLLLSTNLAHCGDRSGAGGGSQDRHGPLGQDLTHAVRGPLLAVLLLPRDVCFHSSLGWDFDDPVDLLPGQGQGQGQTFTVAPHSLVVQDGSPAW